MLQMKLLTSFSKISMKAPLTLLLLITSIASLAATDTTGTWVGTMEHKGTGTNTTVWYVKMNLTTEGDKCYGTMTYDFMKRNSPLTLEVRFKGYVLENTLIINYYSKDIKKTGPEARNILLQFRYNLTLVKNKFNNHIYGDYVGLSKGLIADQTKGYLYLEPYIGDTVAKEALVKKLDLKIDSLIAAKDNPTLSTPPVTDVAVNTLPKIETEKAVVKTTDQPKAEVKKTEAKKLPVIDPPVTKAPPAAIKKDTADIAKKIEPEIKKDTEGVANKTELEIKKTVNPDVVKGKEYKIDTSNLAKAKMEVQSKLKARENVVSDRWIVDSGEVVVEFYDNGTIDGDIITVIHNKNIELSNAMLSDKALRFSFHIDANSPTHEIVMYAENQGTIPPNTALMIITSGNQRKQVFLSSDDKKSAVVVLELRK